MVKLLDTPDPEPGLPFCDVHAHLPPREGLHSRDGRILLIPSPSEQCENFKGAGGEVLIFSSSDLESTVETLDFVNGRPDVFFSCGMGPGTVMHATGDACDAQLSQWIEIIDSNEIDIIAFGEIGLDFHHARTLESRRRQIDLFDRILAAVKPRKKPLVLHVRNAGPGDKDPGNPSHAFNQPDAATRQVVEMLDGHGIMPSTVLFHCYSGPATLNGELAGRGYYFSVPSSAHGFETWYNMSSSLPVDKLMTETDSPFQHPRTKDPINTPENARYAIAAIAHARGIDQETVASITVENARKFFKIT